MQLMTQTRRTRDDGGDSDPERRKRRDEGCEVLMIQKRREWVDADGLRKMMSCNGVCHSLDRRKTR